MGNSAAISIGGMPCMYCAAGPPSGGLGIDWGMVRSLVGVFSARSSAKEPPCVSTKRSRVEGPLFPQRGYVRIGINEKDTDGDSEQFVLESCWGDDMIEGRIQSWLRMPT